MKERKAPNSNGNKWTISKYTISTAGKTRYQYCHQISWLLCGAIEEKLGFLNWSTPKRLGPGSHPIDDAIWVKPVLQLTQWQIFVFMFPSSSLVTLSALYFSPGLFFSDPSTHILLVLLSDFHYPACTWTFVHNCMICVLVALLGPKVRASDGSHQSFSWYVPMILFFGMIHELLFTV